MSAHSHDRRTFLKTVPVAAGGCALLSACGPLEPNHNPDFAHKADMTGQPKTDMGTSNADLKPDPLLHVTYAAYPALMNTGGSAAPFSPQKLHAVVVIRTGANTAIALDGLCTHQGCTVAYVAAANNIQCPCHGSKYSVTGQVIMGPAPLPLKSYPAVVGPTEITVTVG